MYVVEIALGILLAIGSIHFWWVRKRNNYQVSIIAEQMNQSIQMKRTLAMGIYLRFKAENKDENVSYSKHFIKQDPLAFESFVAVVMKGKYGGDTWVSPSSGDFGVDIEHEREDGLYLGQVKCYKDDLSYESIALIHSNMVKRGAKGGFVVTTSDFSNAAKDYADELNIELINGVKLVEYWLEGLEQTESILKDFGLEYS